MAAYAPPPPPSCIVSDLFPLAVPPLVWPPTPLHFRPPVLTRAFSLWPPLYLYGCHPGPLQQTTPWTVATASPQDQRPSPQHRCNSPHPGLFQRPASRTVGSLGGVSRQCRSWKSWKTTGLSQNNVSEVSTQMVGSKAPQNWMSLRCEIESHIACRI
jgi:hypothetical protein